ncbi:MAG TPA: 3-oxoacyl-ACP reductase, partial [Gammaproteobacteria bacterium]|nr:3-oxoacyl-ACP reductase [Gammaproteobacteria bacterium]
MIESLFSMSGKVCVITGGSTGLGSYMAQGFLEAGAARVYITARSAEKLEAKAAQLSAIAGGECVPVVGDLATLEGVAALSAALREREQYIDVLVNNAGLGTGGPFAQMSAHDWDRTMDINL